MNSPEIFILHFCNFTPKKFLFYFLTHFRNLWLIMNREELLHGSLGGGKMYIEQWDKGGKGWIWLLTKGILGHNTQMGAQMNGQVGGREMEKGIPWRQRQGMRDVDRNDGRPAIHLHHMLCYSQHSKRWVYLRDKLFGICENFSNDIYVFLGFGRARPFWRFS